MADDSEISNGSEAADKCEDAVCSELKGPTENKDDIAAAPSSSEIACSICLDKLEDKAFTDSCKHQFCFQCLLKWAKLKAVCPLCKVQFKKIIHNVRSNDDYDEYHLCETTPRASSGLTVTDSGFRVIGLSLEEVENRRRVLQQHMQHLYHRRTYAPHSVRPHPARSASLQEQLDESRNMRFRRYLYGEDIWTRPRISEVGISSPALYRENHASSLRLVPWLTRELFALLNDADSVRFILDFILSLIMRYDIRSDEFFLQLQPHFQFHTSHFVHEFYNFATSIYDVDRYDELLQYDLDRTPISSPGNDVIAVSSDSGIEAHARIASEMTVLPPDSSSHVRLEKHDRTQQKTLMETRERSSRNVERPSPLPLSRSCSLPSSSRGISASPLVTPPLVTLSSSDDDECLIVEEVIELSSSSEADVEQSYTPDLDPVNKG